MSRGQEAYRFTTSGSTVTAVYEVENGRTKQERMERDETWSFDGKLVTKTEMDDGRLETTTYADPDGDGLFVKVGKTYATSATSGTTQTGSGVYSSGSSGSDNGSGSHDSGHDSDHDGGHDSGYGYVQSGVTTAPTVTGGSVTSTTTGSTAPTLQSADKGYKFDISNGVVTGVYEVKYGRVKADRIDQNETYTVDGADVLKTERDFGDVEYSLFSDSDNNGVYQKTFEIDVNTGAKLRSLETYQFKFADGSALTGNLAAEGDVIATMQALGRYGWKNDPIYSNETLQVIEVGADNLILQTQLALNGKIKFSIFRDDDSDGLWTEIAEGETLDEFVTIDDQIDLVGIIDAGYLQAADGIVG